MYCAMGWKNSEPAFPHYGNEKNVLRTNDFIPMCLRSGVPIKHWQANMEYG